MKTEPNQSLLQTMQFAVTPAAKVSALKRSALLAHFTNYEPKTD
jgi:hypothetical protein